MTPSIFMDGRRLVGTTWIRPTDYEDHDAAAGLLPAMKGMTPAELPTLDDHQAGAARGIS